MKATSGYWTVEERASLYLVVGIGSMSVSAVSTSTCAGDNLGKRAGHVQGLYYPLPRTRLADPSIQNVCKELQPADAKADAP